MSYGGGYGGGGGGYSGGGRGGGGGGGYGGGYDAPMDRGYSSQNYYSNGYDLRFMCFDCSVPIRHPYIFSSNHTDILFTDTAAVTPTVVAMAATAAAAVLVSDDLTPRTYELGGDTAFTLAELAADAAEVSGRPVVYQDLTTEAYADVLVQAGLPRGYAEVLADGDRGLAAGELRTGSGDLSRLIGRPTTPPRDLVREALAGAGV